MRHLVVYLGDFLFPFKWKWQLVEHMGSTHKCKRPFSCKLCRIAFAKKKSLTSHHRHKHSDRDLFSCELCGSSFPWKGYLLEHMKLAHRDENHSHASCVENDLPGGDIWLKHTCIKVGVRSYKCDVSGKKYTNTSLNALCRWGKHRVAC